MAALRQRAGNVLLCEQIIAKELAWNTDKLAIVEQIVSTFSNRSLAIRSSAINEDGWDESRAGENVSLIGISSDVPAVTHAIDTVFASYDAAHPNNEVLVQPMVEDVVISGVVLTRDLDTGSPYFVVNYDDITGRTDTVTGGAESKTLYIYRGKLDAVHSSRFRKLLESVIEIERITNVTTLDIEFCITVDDNVYILQVRPIAAKKRWVPVSVQLIDDAIAHAHQRIVAAMAPQEKLAGNTTFFGDMTDWNPAEMIGNSPRPLAASLYRHLITDHVWADGRAQMGYRYVKAPLMATWCGHPYIDIRLSLNSFLPASLPTEIAERIVNFQLAALSEAPDNHDKIEFNIATTCRDFAFQDAAARLAHAGLSKLNISSLESGLHEITYNALTGRGTPLNKLVARADQLLNAAPPQEADLPSVKALLTKCKESGTLPFSILARHGFIAVQLLRSLISRNIMSSDDLDEMMRSIKTVASDVAHDMSSVTTGKMEVDAFLRRYGHLRPGTYDIASPRYDECPELYLSGAHHNPTINRRSFSPRPDVVRGIAHALGDARYDIEPDTFFRYLTSAIKAREQAKFAFTRSVSDALKGIGQWGKRIGLSRDDLSYLPIDFIFSNPSADLARDRVAEEKESHQKNRAIRLPHLICEPDDIFVVRLPLGQPTFITGQSITAPIKVLSGPETTDIDGYIVMIDSADPGFDWIFSHALAGLVTKYGGANSHMAIRCAEFGLPAAIGCGERLYATLAGATVVNLNCVSRTIKGHGRRA